MFVLLLSGITNAQTFDFFCAPEKTRFEIIEELSVADKVTVVATEDDILTSQVSSTNFTFTEFPGEQLSTMSDNQFNITKAGIEATVAKYLANIARIAERLEELNAIADESTYTHVEGSYFNANNYIFRVIRTSSDGSLIDYFVNSIGQNRGISDAELESEDATGADGWDQFLIDAKQAVVDSEKDGLNEILADLTASRNDELLGIHDSVSVAWDSNIGHIVSVGNQRIHSNDFGHRNFGKMSQEQFDLGLSFAVRTAVRSYLSIPFAEIAQGSNYYAQIVTGTGYTYFQYHHIDSGLIDAQVQSSNLEDLDQSVIDNIKTNITNIINDLIDKDNNIFDSTIPENEEFDLGTKFEDAITAINGTSSTVSASISVGIFPEGHAKEGEDFTKVIFADPNNYTTPLTTGFLNGQKLLSDASVTETEFNNWVATWPGYVSAMESEINGYSGTREQRISYIESLATGNTTVVHGEDVGYTAGEQNNGDVFTISYEGASSTSFNIVVRPVYAGSLPYGYIEDLTPEQLIYFYDNLLKPYIAQAQLAYDNQ